MAIDPSRPGEQTSPGTATSFRSDDYEWEEYESNDDAEAGPSLYERALDIDDRQLIQALGWFSIGLGAVELLAPRALNRAIGVGDHPVLTRLLGVREIVTGVGLLSERAPGWWALARAAGDAMDLALLGAATRSPDADPQRIAVAATSVIAVGAVDVLASQRLFDSAADEGAEVQVCESLAINASPQQLYTFWRNAENLPQFMRHLESVQVTGERTSHWVARAPAGNCVEWDSEIVNEIPGQLIAWKTVGEPDVAHAGSVHFTPVNGGTEVKFVMDYEPPAGRLVAVAAKVMGESPDQKVRSDLKRLKMLFETGEVATSVFSPRKTSTAADSGWPRRRRFTTKG